MPSASVKVERNPYTRILTVMTVRTLYGVHVVGTVAVTTTNH
jgi:hypothetical protein